MYNQMSSIDTGAVLALITDQLDCEKIILSASALAENIQKNLYVLNIGNPDMPDSDSRHSALEHLFTVSKENGAVMLVQYSHSPIKAISRYIEDISPCAVVTGVPFTQDSLLYKLWVRFSNIQFYISDRSGVLSEVSVMDKIIR